MEMYYVPKGRDAILVQVKDKHFQLTLKSILS